IGAPRRHLLEIVAGGEGRPVRRDDDDAHCGIGRGGVERFLERAHQRLAQGVAGAGAIEGQAPYGAVGRGENQRNVRLCVHLTLRLLQVSSCSRSDGTNSSSRFYPRGTKAPTRRSESEPKGDTILQRRAVTPPQFSHPWSKARRSTTGPATRSASSRTSCSTSCPTGSCSRRWAPAACWAWARSSSPCRGRCSTTTRTRAAMSCRWRRTLSP